MLAPRSGLAPALVLLAGCAGSRTAAPPATTGSPPATGEGSEVPRPVVGDACVAFYRADVDATTLVLEIPGVGIVGSILLGDGWSIDCRFAGDRFVAAENEAAQRVVTITVDRGMTGPLDLEAYAREGVERSVALMTQEGMTVRSGEPRIVGDGTYAVGFEAELQGTYVAQLSVWKVFLSPIGLLRYHASEFAEDGRALNEHAGDLIRAASVFQVIPPESS